MNMRKLTLKNIPRQLREATAQGLMATNPRSIHESATVAQAAEFLCNVGISAAPVIDDAGRPVGVVSQSDILRHLGRGKKRPSAAAGRARTWEEGTTIPVHRIMTHAVFSVPPNTPAADILAKLVAWDVRRLFVVDPYGVLVGVVIAF